MSHWIGGDTKPNGNDRFTKVLLHFDGNLNDDAAGAANSHSWSGTASATLSGTPKFGTGAGRYPNTNPGVVAHLCAANSDFSLGSGDFTIDFWLKYRVVTSTGVSAGWRSSDGLSNSWMTTVSGGGSLGSAPSGSFIIGFTAFATGGSVAATATVTSDFTGLHHFAAVRSGNILTCYADGIAGTPVAVSGDLPDSTGSLGIGRPGSFQSSNGFNGDIDEFRISVGIARWTSDFTPPARAYTRFLGSGS